MAEWNVIGRPIVTNSDGSTRSPSQTHETTTSGPFVRYEEAERTVTQMMGTGRFWEAWIDEAE